MTIHSGLQLEAFKSTVDQKSIQAANGTQSHTNDGYAILLSMKIGLPCMQIRPFTDSEWEELPHVILT